MPCPGRANERTSEKRVLQKRAYQLGSQLFELASDGLVSRARWSKSVVVLVVHKGRHVKIGCNQVRFDFFCRFVQIMDLAAHRLIFGVRKDNIEKLVYVTLWGKLLSQLG